MYTASETRYDKMIYRRCGKSGLKLPAVSLGMWHNFGSVNDMENMKKILFTAFDNGITHFDLANNYGPVYGSAEENMGRILKSDLMPYRKEMVISSKAGYDMWKGPYGDGGSKKYLISSLDESLKKLGLDYVDIFYHHRPDPDTPIEETMQALDQIVKSGKALYVGMYCVQPFGAGNPYRKVFKRNSVRLPDRQRKESISPERKYHGRKTAKGAGFK